jgi:hypothetical protein
MVNSRPIPMHMNPGTDLVSHVYHLTKYGVTLPTVSASS